MLSGGALTGCTARMVPSRRKTDYPHVQGMSDSVGSGSSAPTCDELRNASEWMDKMADYAVRNKDPGSARRIHLRSVKRH